MYTYIRYIYIIYIYIYIYKCTRSIKLIKADSKKWNNSIEVFLCPYQQQKLIGKNALVGRHYKRIDALMWGLCNADYVISCGTLL